MKLEQEDLDQFPSGHVFAYGYHFLVGFWSAVRGGIADWAIYVVQREANKDYIAQHGDKVHDDNVIRSLVYCTDEAFQSYRR